MKMKSLFGRLMLLVLATMLGFAACEDPIVEELINDDIPTVLTNEVTDIAVHSTKCGGYVSAQGGAEVVARGVCYSTSPNPQVTNSRTENGQGIGGYTSNLEGLTAATTYYIRAYATNANGTAYGEERSFTTAEGNGDENDTTQNEDGTPIVTTDEVTDIDYTSAVCGGNVVSEELILARGICWSTLPNPTANNNFTNEGQGTGSFTSIMATLSAGTTYYVRAYATNVNGTAYGEERSFSTLQYSLPIVTTDSVFGISSTGAMCNGNVISNGGLEIIERGVCWSMSSNPTINNNKSSIDGNIGRFGCPINGLQQNTTYYVRTYATNSLGTAYGEELSFTTPNAGISVTFGTASWNAEVYQGEYYSGVGAVLVYGQAVQNQEFPLINMAFYTTSTGTYTDAINSGFGYTNGIIAFLEYWEARTWQSNSYVYGDWWAESATINVTALDLTAMTVSMTVNATMFEIGDLVDANGYVQYSLLPNADRRTMTVNVNGLSMEIQSKSAIGKQPATNGGAKGLRVYSR